MSSLEASTATPAAKNVQTVEHAVDSAKNTPPESQGLASWMFTEAKDLTLGVFHGAIEDPINSVVQLANHTVGTSIPEMHLVDTNEIEKTVGGKVGEIAGRAADFVGLTLLTGGIGTGAGIAATALRMGAIGAAYGGLLTPTDDNSTNFWGDKLRTTGVDAATFAAMGGAGAELNSTGLFAVPAARSLMGSLGFGAATGLAGGLAHSESNAISNGDVVPSFSQLGNDLATYTAFGAFSGGMNWEINRLTLPDAHVVQSGAAKITVQTDQAGNPVKVDQVIPSSNYPDQFVQWKSTMMTNGQWKDNLQSLYHDGSVEHGVGVPNIGLKDITNSPTGAITTLDDQGVHRTFTPNQPYTSDILKAKADVAAAAAAGAPYATKAADGSWQWKDSNGNVTQTQVNDANGVRVYDQTGHLERAYPTNAIGNGGLYQKFGSTSLGYSNNGDISRLGTSDDASAGFQISRGAGNSWSYVKDGMKYEWKGDIKVAAPAAPGAPEQVSFIKTDGTTTTVPIGDVYNATSKIMSDSAAYVPGGTGNSFVTVDANGHATITGGTAQAATVNDVPLKAGQQVPINYGDRITVKSDIGDRYADYKTDTLKWTGDPSSPTIGTFAVKPNTTFDTPITPYSIWDR